MEADTLPGWEGVDSPELKRRWGIPQLVIRDTTSSTNDDAAALAARGAPAGTTVIAERQTAGRGRRGRAWSASPARSILISIVFRAGHREDGSVMPLRVGLAAVRALRSAARIDAQIKWPNDIVLPDGAKIGGILCEASTTDRSAWLVAGVGINVLQTPDEIDASLLGRASSVLIAGGVPDRLAIGTSLLDALQPFEVRPPPLLESERRELDRLHVLRGQPVTVDGRPAGIARDIAPDGSLAIETDAEPLFLRTGTVRIDDRPRTDDRAARPTGPTRAERAS